MYTSLLGYVLNAHDGDTVNSRIHHTSRVDSVIYPSTTDASTRIALSETGPMLSVALKITVDPRLDVKVISFCIVYTSVQRFLSSRY